MATAQRNVELSVFVAKLISDVSDGIRQALRIQAEALDEIISSSTLDAREFAKRTVGDNEIDTELTRLFPSDDERHPHAVFEGAPYRATSVDTLEIPPFLNELGVRLEAMDYTTRRGGRTLTLTTAGVAKIREAARERAASVLQKALRRSVAAGIPQVVVDAGTVSVPISIRVQVQPTERRTPVGAAAATEAIGRIVVDTVDDRAPQTQNLSVNILGRLELTFKTLS